MSRRTRKSASFKKEQKRKERNAAARRKRKRIARAQQRALRLELTEFVSRIVTDFTAHGNTSWTKDHLYVCAVLWCLAEGDSWRSKYDRIQDFVEGDLGFEGFLKALTREREFASCLAPMFREETRSVAERLGTWEVAGRVPFAVDGTKFELPRTVLNQEAFCATGKSSHQSESDAKKKDNPQLMVTNIWHVSSNLPWDWRYGPCGASERALMSRMINDLPENAVLLGDAAYTGYEFWTSLQDTDFVVRVGGNVHLITNLTSDDADGIVYLWPEEQRKSEAPPIRLRLITIKLKEEVIYLVTNIPDLTEEEAKELYLARWGVEVHHRDFKDAFFNSGKLRAATPERVKMEITWTFISYWTTRLLAVQAKLRCPSKTKTGKNSFTQLRKLINAAVLGQAITETPFTQALADALVDRYTRKNPKTSRGYPRKKKHSPTLPPKVRLANEKERKAKQKVNVVLGLCI